MNDFTKEELEELRNAVPGCSNLRRKIEALIDNYCEHNELKEVE